MKVHQLKLSTLMLQNQPLQIENLVSILILNKKNPI